MDIANGFGTQHAFLLVVETYVRSRPDLLEDVERARQQIRPSIRVGWLFGQLDKRIDLWQSPDKYRAALAALPEDYQTLYVLEQFEEEFMNGGVHQFFYNSSGAVAPQVVVALRRIGMERQADLLAFGLAHFRTPYPTQTQRRREIYFHNHEWNFWDESLSALTDQIWAVEDAGYISLAIEKFARDKGLLPD
jgi:hypothetical protein